MNLGPPSCKADHDDHLTDSILSFSKAPLNAKLPIKNKKTAPQLFKHSEVSHSKTSLVGCELATADGDARWRDDDDDEDDDARQRRRR